MAPQEDYTPVDEFKIGLDRSAINQDGRIQLPQHEPRSKGDVAHDRADGHDESELTRSQTHRTVDSLKEKKHHAAIKIRKTLHLSKASDNTEPEKRTVLVHDVNEQSDSRLVHELPDQEKPTFKDLVHNPVDTVKSKVSGQAEHEAAANIAAKEVPHGQDVDLVNAHAAVKDASTEKEKLRAIEDLTRLMQERQNTFARWTLDRHVTKLRVLPRETVKKPNRLDFQKHTPGEGVVIDWNGYAQQLMIYYAQMYGGQYIGYGSDPPTPSKETIMPNVERLLIASSPLQEFIMTTRRVYRWENPSETTKYLLIYLALWYFNMLLPGVISAIIYLVVERRVNGDTLDDLRKDITHREDTEKTALSLAELIVKKGDEKWADELLEGLGPWAMVQLADLANFFETTRNFYEWRVPHRTQRTLIVISLAVPITALVPLWLLVKSMTLAAGFTFFALFPISVNFPEYRLLVSPTKRLLWNIPTHAEWAIKYTQAQGSRVEEQTTTNPAVAPRDSFFPKEEVNYGSYVAHDDKTTGRIIIQTSSIRFVSKVGDKDYWVLPYIDINNLEKIDRIISKNVSSKLQADTGKDLRFVTKAGQERILRNVERRDEVFSQIVGYSDTTWQIVW